MKESCRYNPKKTLRSSNIFAHVFVNYGTQGGYFIKTKAPLKVFFTHFLDVLKINSKRYYEKK